MDFNLACEPQLDDTRFAADLTVYDRAEENITGNNLQRALHAGWPLVWPVVAECALARQAGHLHQ